MLLARTTYGSLIGVLKLHKFSGFKVSRVSQRYNSGSKERWLQRQQNDVYSREAKIQNLRSRAAFKLIELDEKFKLFNKDLAQNVLDLGFAPGSWSQIARRRTNPESVILGVDILPCKSIDGVNAIQANILSKKTHDLIRLFFNEPLKLNTEDNLDEQKGYFTKDYMNEKTSYSTIEANQINKIYPVDVIISDMYVPSPKDFTDSQQMNNLTNMPYYRLMNTSGVAIRDHLRSIDLCDAALVTAIDLLRSNGTFACKLYTGKEEHLFKKRLEKVFKKVRKFKPISSRTESKEVYYVGLDKKKIIDKIDVFST